MTTEETSYHPDSTAPEEKFSFMHSFCGGGGTLRMFFGDKQIARVTPDQIADLMLKCAYVVSGKSGDDLTAVLDDVMSQFIRPAPSDEVLAEEMKGIRSDE